MIELQTRTEIADLSLGGMIALWERMLNVAPIGPDDDFFDLGGDSLQALNLFHEIERIAGRALPITAIYDAATPARLASLLNGTSAVMPFSPLVPIKHGAGEPLFIFHGIGGNVVELERVGRAIATHRPVIAMQAKGVDGGDAPLDRVGRMIDFHLPALRAVQPHGPYYLAGYSFGGLLAMEVARRLKAGGETVALLLFIDSFAHQDSFPRVARQIVRVRTVLDAFRTKSPREAIRFVLARLKGHAGPINSAGQILAGDTVAAKTEALRDVYDAASTALFHYRPRPYAGKIVFLRAKTSIFPVAPKRIWGKLVEGIELHTIDADHESLVHGDSGALADAISQAMRRAEANP